MPSSVIDLSIIGTLVTRGILMAALPLSVVITTLGAATLFALVLDEVKYLVFGRLKVA